MALSRPIGWLRDQRGDAVGLATADPLFQGGETKPTGYVATYSPVFTAEQVQQEIKAARADAIARLDLHMAAASKEASMALSDRDCRHGRQIGKCADCDLDHMEMAADAEARRVDELTALRKQDTELMQAALDALTCTGESDDPGHRCGHCDDYVDRNGQVRAALRARLEGKPCA